MASPSRPALPASLRASLPHAMHEAGVYETDETADTSPPSTSLDTDASTDPLDLAFDESAVPSAFDESAVPSTSDESPGRHAPPEEASEAAGERHSAGASPGNSPGAASGLHADGGHASCLNHLPRRFSRREWGAGGSSGGASSSPSARRSSLHGVAVDTAAV